jgi:hypothetical protein
MSQYIPQLHNSNSCTLTSYTHPSKINEDTKVIALTIINQEINSKILILLTREKFTTQDSQIGQSIKLYVQLSYWDAGTFSW